MGLFELPVELAQCIFNEWVNDAKSISSMDIACSGSCRDDLLALLRHPQFLLSTAHDGTIMRMCILANVNCVSCAAFVYWLSHRRVRVTKLTICASSLPTILSINFLILPAVKELVVSPSPIISAEASDRLFSRCPALTSVDFHGHADVFVEQAFRGLLAAPSLPLCKLTFCSSGNFHWGWLRSVAFCFRNTLTDLHIFHAEGTSLDSATLQFIGLTCMVMKSFRFSVEKLTAADVISFLSLCGARLTNVGFRRACWFQESVVNAIVERLPIAEIITGDEIHGSVTWQALQHALQHCPQLRDWGLGDTILHMGENGMWHLLLKNNVVFSDVVPCLTALRHPLIDLAITCANLPQQGIAALIDRHGSTITGVTLLFDESFPHHDGDGLAALINGCSNLTELQIYDFHHFTDALIDQWFVGRVSVLKMLVLHNATAVSCRAFIALTARCPCLELLDLHGCALVSDPLMFSVSLNCPNIAVLGLSNCGMITMMGTMRFITDRLTRPLHLEIPQAIEALVLTLLGSMGDHGQLWIDTVRFGCRTM